MDARRAALREKELQRRKNKAATAGMVTQSNANEAGASRPPLPSLPSTGSASRGNAWTDPPAQEENAANDGSSSDSEENDAAVRPSSRNGATTSAGPSSASSSSSSSSSAQVPATAAQADMEERGIAPSFDGTREAPPREIDWSDMRAGLTQVCPQRTTMQCYIKREKGGLLKSRYPTYYLYATEGDRFLLSAKRRTKNKSSNYVISTSRTNQERDSDHFFAKLRSNFVGTEFVLYDGGVNPKKAVANDTVRQELSAVFYRTNILGYKGPRQMQVVVPRILPSGLPRVFRPEKPEEGLVDRVKEDKLDDLILLKNKEPVWNEKTRAYVLNFSGRVTQASVKNFQLISPGMDSDYVVLQFGKTGKDTFNMDFQYPLTCLQAFAVVLSSFDSKTLVE